MARPLATRAYTRSSAIDDSFRLSRTAGPFVDRLAYGRFMTRHASVLAVTLSLAIGSATLPAPALAQTVAAPAVPPSWAVPGDDRLSLRNVVAEAFSDLMRLPSWE